MDIIEVQGLEFTYNGEEKKVINNLDMRVKKGDFVILCGESGSGKTTFLKLLKSEIAPYGRMRGKIFIDGMLCDGHSDKELLSKVGYVFQNPDNQIVTDKVWHELVFGLENMGMSQMDMKKRLAEITAYFNLENLIDRNTWELSGGEKQKVNIACVVAMKPQVILLDEPLGQLDPVASQDFAGILRKINRELGVTVIIAEHNLEYILDMADMLGIMEGGRLAVYDDVRSILNKKGDLDIKRSIMDIMPVPVRLHNIIKTQECCPLDVCGAKSMLSNYMENAELNRCLSFETGKDVKKGEKVIKLKDVYFRYGRYEKDVLKHLNMEIYRGEVCSILGNNGSGKTTMVKVLAGILRPYSGKVKIHYENMAYLPQNPQSLFVKDSLKDDMLEVGSSDDIERMAAEFDMEELICKHPYDISGGEQQRAALMKVLLKSPDIVLMDEPTKGMDKMSKRKFGKILEKLKTEGITVVMVTHDLEFAAEYSDRCGIFFNHEVAVLGETREVLCGNAFYTTESFRIGSEFFKNVLTFEELEYAVGKMVN